MDRKKREAESAEAKRRCRLADGTLALAKDLGLNPRSLIKNVPSRSEPWKAPVAAWIRELHRKRQQQAARRRRAAQARTAGDEWPARSVGAQNDAGAPGATASAGGAEG